LVIHFANNSARITVDPNTLQAIADVVHDRSSVTLTGYTDANYPDAQGERLAERRARAVRKVLIERGVAAEHLRLDYYAARHFAADNQTPEGKELNRRVEIVSTATAEPSQG